METSEFIARLAGPLLMVMGLALTMRRRLLESIVDQFAASTALIFFAGMLALTGGLAIVNVHNVWTGDWRVIVTLLGWASIVGGTFRMLLPDQVAAIQRHIASFGLVVTIAGGILLVLGAILAGKGYGLAGKGYGLGMSLGHG